MVAVGGVGGVGLVWPEKAVQEPKAAQLPQATEPPEPEDDEPELTPEQRAAAERRKAEITRTVQVSIEQIEDAEAEQAEKEADTPESTDSKVGRAVRQLIGWQLLVVLLAALPLWLLPNAEFGGADGQAAFFVTTRLAPHLLGTIAVAAYS